MVEYRGRSDVKTSLTTYLKYILRIVQDQNFGDLEEIIIDINDKIKLIRDAEGNLIRLVILFESVTKKVSIEVS